MKAAVVIGIVAAALAGALAATVLDGDDGPDELIAAAPASSAQPVAAAADAEPVVQRPGANQRPAPRGDGRVYIEPDDRPIASAELDRVRDAAIAAVGGGIVTDIDRSDDLGTAYEVEVVQDTQEIDVRLDGDLGLVAQDYED